MTFSSIWNNAYSNILCNDATKQDKNLKYMHMLYEFIFNEFILNKYFVTTTEISLKVKLIII